MYDSAITKTRDNCTIFSHIHADTRANFRLCRPSRDTTFNAHKRVTKPPKQNKKMVTGTTPNWRSRQYNSVILVFPHIQIKKDLCSSIFLHHSYLHIIEKHTLSVQQTLAQKKLPLRTCTNLIYIIL